MAHEVERKSADTFFELAKETRSDDPLAARAIEIAGTIAELRHYSYELALERALPPTEISKTTKDERHALRRQTKQLQAMYDRLPGGENRRTAIRLALQAICIEKLVLTPALQTYPPGNDSAKTALHDAGSAWMAIRSMASKARDYAVDHPDDIHALHTVTELTLFGLANRETNTAVEVLPTPVGVRHGIEAELFLQAPNNQVQHTYVHAAFIALQSQNIPGRAAIGRRELGLAPHAEPWRSTEYATIQAFDTEYASLCSGHPQLETIQKLNDLQVMVANQLAATAVPYALETALAVPPTLY